MNTAYHEDLAYVHDAGYGHVARAAAPVLLRALGASRGLVVDLGCGSGILAEALTDAGLDVLGIDQSEAMLALARRRAPHARFQAGSLLSADLPPCRAVTAVGECFNYLFDPTNSPEALAALFRRIHAALVPGGVVLFDVPEPGRVPGPGPAFHHREGADWVVLATTEEDADHRILTRRITVFRAVGELYRRSHEVHRLRLLPRTEVAEQLRQAGFAVRVLSGYGDFAFPPGYAGFLATK